MTPTIEQDTTRTLTVPPKARRTSQRPVRGGKPLISYGQWWWALPAILLVLGVQYAATLTGGFLRLHQLDRYRLVRDHRLRQLREDLRGPAVARRRVEHALPRLRVRHHHERAGLLFALAINRTLKTRYILRTLLFMPVVLSPLAVAYVWKFIFQFNGPLNGFLGAIGLESLQKTWLADPTWSIWAILITVVWQQDGLHDGHLPRGPRLGAGRGRGGGGPRRCRRVGALLETSSSPPSVPRSRSPRPSGSSRACASSTRSSPSPGADLRGRPRRWPPRSTRTRSPSASSASVRHSRSC